MNSILVIGEDSLCCALGERLVKTFLPNSWKITHNIDTGGVTVLWEKIKKYHEVAQNLYPVLCIADTDNECVRNILHDHLPQPCNAQFLFRLAVTEAESWLLADQKGFAQAFSVSLDKLPRKPDSEPDPKFLILTLAVKSKNRAVRTEIVKKEGGRLKRGPGYNMNLCSFVRKNWDVHVAAQNSPSLARAIRRLKTLRHQGTQDLAQP